MKQLIKSYKNALKFSVSHWRLSLLLYCVHMLVSMIIYYPLKSFLGSILSGTMASEKLVQSFDFGLIMDLFHLHSEVLSFVIPLITLAIFIYFLWINFMYGGVIGSLGSSSRKIGVFLDSGFTHFFKNMRFSLYLIFFYFVIVYLAYMYFAKDGLNVFELEAEDFLVERFNYLFVLLIIVFFLTGIMNVLSRIWFCQNSSNWIFKDMIHGFKSMFGWNNILLSLINWIPLLLISLMYFALLKSDSLSDNSLLLFLLAQILVYARIILKLTRIASFYKLTIQ